MFLTLSIALAVQARSVQVPAPLESAEVPCDAVIGTVDVRPIAAQSDDVPLPNAAVWAASDSGDVLVQPASGDPFFLGFAAGKHYPPADERIDPALSSIASTLPNDGRPKQETYAFVMFQKRITDARVAQLASVGARVLSFHPHYCTKVALPPSAIDTVAGFDFVRWIGVEQSWQKLHPQLSTALADATPGKPLHLWVDVFDSDLGPNAVNIPIARGYEADPAGNVVEAGDSAQSFIVLSNGWQQRALEELGARVVEYVDDIRAFRVELAAERVEELVARDFVQFIELDTPPQALHDESMPLCNADRTRATYDGAAATVGIIDSGMNFLHNAIDPYVIGWEYSTDATLYWDDQNTHGTHVSGTMIGNADIEDSYAGAAPGVGPDTAHRVFVAKILNAAGSGTGVSLPAVLTQMRTAYTDSSNVTTSRPMVVNNSYGTPGGPWYGTEADARAIDDVVYDWDQLYVFAAGNSGSGGSTMLKESSSKNALSVGSVYDWDAGSDPGEVASSSSRGPTDDDRWKPNLCAPGNSILSCDANDTNGYTTKTGTSMACPHVTGIAAQLCDHYSFLRYNPSCLSAVLMAGAITKNNTAISTPSTDPLNHLNQYGTGRVDAYKAQFGDSQQALYFWAFGQSTSGYGSLDFAVNSGATRVTIVMHYKEESASSGASSALVNDLDMYVDVAPFAAGGNTGDYVAQQSPRDNTEIRIINSPTVANWRIKVYPSSVVAGQTCKVGVCAIVTYGATAPTPTYSVTTSDAYIHTNTNTTVTASYTNPSYIASAVYLDSSSTGDSLQAVTTLLEDGASTDLLGNLQSGRDVLLGDVLHGTNRYATWTTRWATEGAKTFSVQARSDNATDVTDSVTIYVDNTAPPLPTGLASTTHTINTWSNDAAIAFQWTQPADNVSGLDGYSWTLANAFGLPNTTKDIGAVVSYATNFNPLTDTGTWWFNLRPVDKCANWNGSYVRAGPFLLDFIQPAYVTGLASSTHALSSYSCNPNVTVTWNPTPDSGGSGLAGYYVDWSHVASEPPSGVNSIGVVTSLNASLTPSAQPWYFHITPFDHAGNTQNFFNLGPFYIVNPTPVIYCTGKTNSAGCVPAIGSTGVASKSAGTFTVTCSNALNNKNGLLFFGFTPTNTPFQGGTKCVASPTYRGPNSNSGGSASGNDCTGNYAQQFSTSFMNAYSLDPGDTVYAQWWTRDPGVVSTTGLSNAIQFTICQ